MLLKDAGLISATIVEKNVQEKSCKIIIKEFKSDLFKMKKKKTNFCLAISSFEGVKRSDIAHKTNN